MLCEDGGAVCRWGCCVRVGMLCAGGGTVWECCVRVGVLCVGGGTV